MGFLFNNFDKIETPDLYLATPNKKYLGSGALRVSDFNTDFNFNAMDELHFNINKKDNTVYDNIENLNLIEVTSLGWFQITDVNEIGNGRNCYKKVTAKSLENELCTKILTSFGQLGTEDDLQGGLDRYCLYNTQDTEHSIMHIVLRELPTWSIGHIDGEITDEYRSFDDDNIDVYSFLTKSVSEAFECIFIFNTYEQTVSAYKLANVGENTNIYLGYDNLVKETNMSADFSHIKTKLTVYGGDDRGSTLNIIQVNPTGTNDIYDFTYYQKYMSQGLVDHLAEYQSAYELASPQYQTLLSDLQTLQDEKLELETNVPENENDWSTSGLDYLETMLAVLEASRVPYINATTPEQIASWDDITNQIEGTSGNPSSGIKYHINLRTQQIATKTQQIDAKKIELNNAIISLEDYLTLDEQNELSRFVHADTYTDTNCIVTDSMSESEIIQMKNKLLEKAKGELAIISKPKYTVQISAINFLHLPAFISFSRQLNVGDVITVDFGSYYIECRVLKIHINWSDCKDFSISISNRNSLDDNASIFAEIREKAETTNRSYSASKGGYNTAKNQSSIVNDFMTSALNASNNKLVNSDKQEVVLDNTGLHLRKEISQGVYSDKQIWATENQIAFSNDGFRTVKMAIGDINVEGVDTYGIIADSIVGRFILGEMLKIANGDNTLTMDENGLVITNDTNSIAINPNDEDGLFRLKKGTSNLLWIDSNGNLNFKGSLSGATGTFGGSLSAASGSFSGSITGGNININNMFTVDYLGNVITNGNVTLSPGEGKQLILQSPKIETEMLEIDLGYCNYSPDEPQRGFKIVGNEPVTGDVTYFKVTKSPDWNMNGTTFLDSGDSGILEVVTPMFKTYYNVEIGHRYVYIDNYVQFWTATAKFNCRNGVVFDCPVEFSGDGVTFNCPVTFNGTVTGI